MLEKNPRHVRIVIEVKHHDKITVTTVVMYSALKTKCELIGGFEGPFEPYMMKKVCLKQIYDRK